MKKELSRQAGCMCSDECLILKSNEKIPAACPTKTSSTILEEALGECQREGSCARVLWQAFSRLVGSGGAQRSRLEHIIEFSRSAGYKRIGLAGCASYLKQMDLIKRIFKRYGFASIYFCCKVGDTHFMDIDIPKKSNWTLCNPMGQALLLNDWGADLNVQLGLCMGHDLIFNYYSQAPVTVLVVKEKITDDNPMATLNAIENNEFECNPYLVEETF